jgi:uncharacterized protein YcgL (UPF0745 family)
MAKKQSFGDKVLKQKAEAKKMVKVIVASKKDNGHYCFVSKMVEQDNVAAELKAAKA